MNFQSPTDCQENQFRIENVLPKMGKDVVIKTIVKGLSAPQKSISSMFFYDAAGSKLFEEITQLPEYYPTRTEMPLIKAAALTLQDKFEHTDIVEIGSGDCSKISMLLTNISEEICQEIRYIPIDVSLAAIEESAKMLSARFPQISVHGVVADFISQLHMIPKGHKRLFCFFGSTLGNFTRADADQFFKTISKTMQPGDRLLLGLDRVKDKQIIERAYNDQKGITAAFNRNSLNVLNALIGSDFDPATFEHDAFYNEAEDRIEMHLRAMKKTVVTSPHFENALSFSPGETIHTENSHKFSDAHIAQLQKKSGLQIEEHYSDPANWFSLIQFVKPVTVSYAAN